VTILRFFARAICLLIAFTVVSAGSGIDTIQSIESSSSADSRPLSLLLLMDASGSMKVTDPSDYRKLAAQAVVSLLSPIDRLAVIEFDSDGRILSDWTSASERDKIIHTIALAGNKGAFTDFRAALEAAKDVFEGEQADSRKVILLLSDGIFEPNPFSDRYAPYSLDYRLAIRGKDREQIDATYNQYRQKILPVAKRIVDSELLPFLVEQQVQIFCVGFSPNADREFLSYLAEKTSRSKIESHAYFANEAIDLMDAFLGLLQFWQNSIKLYTEQDVIQPGASKKIFVDEHVREGKFIVLTDQAVKFKLKAPNDLEEEPLAFTHQNLKIVPLSKATPPGLWSYMFDSGSGKYRLLIVGKSMIDLEVEGLKQKYLFGEKLECSVKVTIGDKDARHVLGPGSRVVVDVMTEDRSRSSIQLAEAEKGFSLEYSVARAGTLKLRFTLHAWDKNGNEMFPRPSKEYQCVVLPRFYVEPDYISFGELDQGETKTYMVRIVSGLQENRTVRIHSKTTQLSRCEDEVAKHPRVSGANFTIKPGETLSREIVMAIPEEGCWGDYEGELTFSTNLNESFKIRYRVHVPSIWEKLTLPLLVVLAILFLVMIVLVVLWARLRAPVGVLRPLSTPAGVLLDDIELGKVKRGIWSRWFNWKKNRIRIGREHGDIILELLPTDLSVELIFYRFGRDYIKNDSPKESKHGINVKDPEVDIDIQREPGETYDLSSGLRLRVGDYEFAYLR